VQDSIILDRTFFTNDDGVVVGAKYRPRPNGGASANSDTSDKYCFRHHPRIGVDFRLMFT
jgi:hypothetical protein